MMRVKIIDSFRSLIVGIAIGLFVGWVGLAYSAMGKEGWDKQPIEFKLGYIVGSTDVLRMVKRTTLPEEISQTFTIPRGAKPINWYTYVERLFADPKNKDRNIIQILSFAGLEMRNEFGGDINTVSGLEQLGKVLKRRREAIISGEIPPVSPEVVAAHKTRVAKAAARSKCMKPCRKGCKDTCKAVIKEKFPPPVDSTDDGDPPKDEK